MAPQPLATPALTETSRNRKVYKWSEFMGANCPLSPSLPIFPGTRTAAVNLSSLPPACYALAHCWACWPPAASWEALHKSFNQVVANSMVGYSSHKEL
eukprot:scaffold48520_cov19-Tisochrysis_lutea.AAC.1